MKTFKDMQEALAQYSGGLLSEAELIMFVQCDEFQLQAVRQVLALPIAAAAKVQLSDFDSTIEIARRKAASSNVVVNPNA